MNRNAHWRCWERGSLQDFSPFCGLCQHGLRESETELSFVAKTSTLNMIKAYSDLSLSSGVRINGIPTPDPDTDNWNKCALLLGWISATQHGHSILHKKTTFRCSHQKLDPVLLKSFEDFNHVPIIQAFQIQTAKIRDTYTKRYLSIS